jgi:hypothetical protein
MYFWSSFGGIYHEIGVVSNGTIYLIVVWERERRLEIYYEKYLGNGFARSNSLHTGILSQLYSLPLQNTATLCAVCALSQKSEGKEKHLSLCNLKS